MITYDCARMIIWEPKRYSRAVVREAISVILNYPDALERHIRVARELRDWLDYQDEEAAS